MDGNNAEPVYNVIDIHPTNRDRLRTTLIENVNDEDISYFLSNVKSIVETIARECIDTVPGEAVKGNIILRCVYKKAITAEERKKITTYFAGVSAQLFFGNSFTEWYNDQVRQVLQRVERFEGVRESGWVLDSILSLEIRLNTYRPLGGKSYISLPAHIQNRKAVINVQNTDDKCFQYALLAKFVKVHPERVSKYTRNLLTKYEWKNISFPTPLEDVNTFERNNRNCSVNVYGLDDSGNVYPMRVTKLENADHTDVLFLSNAESTHYCWIKDLSKLVSTQLTKTRRKKYICKMCFSHYTREDLLSTHKELCANRELVAIQMPNNEKNILKFSNYEQTQMIPFVAYADFETLIVPHNDTESRSNTSKTHKHYPMSFCIHIVAIDNYARDLLNIKTPIIYQAPDAAEEFLRVIKEIADRVEYVYSRNYYIPPSTDDLNRFTAANECYLCAVRFDATNIKRRKVYDHNHLTGKYRGAACNACNLNFQMPRFFPVFTHGLSKFDAHIICRALSYDNKAIHIIPETEETYISFSKVVSSRMSIRFVDTFRFLASSLEKLANNLLANDFVQTSRHSESYLFDLLRKKGVFPYEYVSNWSALHETKLPSRDKFFSTLTNDTITQQQYEHALNVWHASGVKTLGEYSNLYLRTDCLLLADIFQKFRTVCFNIYKIDAAWNYSAPGLAWRAMLKQTNISISLLTDYDMILFFEEGIRGGVTQCVKRYSKAENTYLQNVTNTSCSKFISYIDANNLYGCAMSEPLPSGDFQWLTREELDTIDILSLPDDGVIGYVFQVDISYGDHLHYSHNDFPLCPESKVMKGGIKKLMCTLEDKKKYVVHYRNLKQAIQYGMQITMIHRGIRFSQSWWLKEYVDLNTERRKRATNEFEKDFFKLMVNSVFGKTIENIRLRENIKLTSDKAKFTSMVSKSTFKDRTVFSENPFLVAVRLRKTRLVFDKPIFIGMAILELSKLIMYNFHYDVMLPKYGPEKVNLCYMDTDSYIYEIHTRDWYEDMLQLSDYFDTSDYPTTHKCFNDKNKKKLGKFKDEANGRLIVEFIGLRPKLYALQLENENGPIIKKAKGVKKNVVNNEITIDHYKHCLSSNISQHRIMHTLRSEKHIIYTMKQRKNVLSTNDDKRIILSDNIHTLAIGHCDLKHHRVRLNRVHAELKLKLGKEKNYASFEEFYDT